MDVRIPLSADEYAELKRRAEAAGRTRADWVRRLIFGLEAAPPPPEGFRMRDGRSARRDGEAE